MVVVAVVLAGAAWWYLEHESANGAPVKPEDLLVANPVDDAVPVEALRDRLIVLHDLKGNYVAIVPYWDKKKTDEHYFFFGNATAMYAQRVRGGGRSGRESFSYSVWDPRFQHAGFEFRDDIYRIDCGDVDRNMAVVPKSEAAAILAGKFYKPKWKHHAYAFAKNQKSEYVYVDKSLHSNDFRGFHRYQRTIQAT